MPTHQQFIEEAIERGGRDFGLFIPITSAAAQTVVCSTRAMGEPASTYVGKYMIRYAPATAADSARQISDFAGSTGTFTHTGTAYSDTTATGEYIFVTPFDPNIIRRALQQSVENLRFLDKTEIPTYNGTRYWLRPAEYPWLTSRGMVARVGLRNSPVLTRNRYMQNWRTIASTGAITPPSDWTNTSATVSRSTQATTDLRRGAYIVKMDHTGTTCTLGQTIGVLPSGADLGSNTGESLIGKTVTAVIVASTTNATCRLNILANGSSIATVAIPQVASGVNDEYSVAVEVPAGTAYLEVQAEMYDADQGNLYIHEMYLMVGELTDAVRRDEYPMQDIHPLWLGGNPLSFEVGNYGYGRQIVLETRRPYPSFDATRLQAGEGTADISDAPLVPVAAGILARVYKAYEDVDPKYARLAVEWQVEAQALAAAHLQGYASASGGLNIPKPQPRPGVNRLARG